MQETLKQAPVKVFNYSNNYRSRTFQSLYSKKTITVYTKHNSKTRIYDDIYNHCIKIRHKYSYLDKDKQLPQYIVNIPK
jgi:hypothetical protein